MPRRKTDADNPPRFLSILAAAAGALVAHRFLLKLTLVLMVGVVLMTRGPDEVREGLNTIIESAPVQLVARALFSVSGITLGALPTAPRLAPQAVSTPMVRDGADGSSTATPSSTRGPLSQTAPQDPAVKTLVPAGRVEHQRPQVLDGRGDGQIRGSRGVPNDSSNRISGSVAVADGQLNPAIGRPNPALYRSNRDASEWRNPILTVQDDGVDVKAKGITGINGNKHVAVDELKALLISLPVSAWPYGRVVAQTDQGILPVPFEDYLRKMSQTRARVSQVLKELRITAEPWPS